jgi:hypothetical protein
VVTIAMVVTWVFVRRDCPALEWEVASYSFPSPRWEEQEEPTMDQMSTIVVKLEYKELASYLVHQMSKHHDTSTGTATIAARCGALLVGLRFS